MLFIQAPGIIGACVLKGLGQKWGIIFTKISFFNVPKQGYKQSIAAVSIFSGMRLMVVKVVKVERPFKVVARPYIKQDRGQTAHLKPPLPKLLSSYALTRRHLANKITIHHQRDIPTILMH